MVEDTALAQMLSMPSDTREQRQAFWDVFSTWARKQPSLTPTPEDLYQKVKVIAAKDPLPVLQTMLPPAID